MKKRNAGTLVQQQRKQPRVPQKKPCDLGSSCPYQEEFQHLMEFSHDCAPVPKPSSNFGRETGMGNRLGGVHDRSMGEWGRGNVVGSDPTRRHPHSNLREDEDKVQCQLCLKLITLDDLDRHLQTHDNSGDGLKREQDVQYEESVLQDIQKQSALELEKQEQKRKEIEKNELKEFNEALVISKIAAAKAKREEASVNLLPEPAADYLGRRVTLRFTLASGKKLIRTFCAEHSIQDAFNYMHSLEELEGKSVYLRNAVNTLVIRPNEMDTFLDLGITTNTSLLVVEVDEESVSAITAAGKRAVTGTPPDTCQPTSTTASSSSSNSNSSQPQEQQRKNPPHPSPGTGTTSSRSSSASSSVLGGMTAVASSKGCGQSADSAITLITPTSSSRKKPRTQSSVTADVVDLTFS